MPREIFGTIIKNGVPVVGACVTQSLVEPRAFNALGIVPTYQNQVETNEAGYFSMLVDVPDDPTLGWEHEFDFGDGNKRRITIGAGPSVNISAFFDPDYPFGDEEYGVLGMPLIDPVTAVGNLPTIALGGSLVDGGTGIVLEQDPNQPTAARNALATGVAPNHLGIGAVDLQTNRTQAANVASGNYSFAQGNDVRASGHDSFASGTWARALHLGAFVRADSQGADFPSIRDNEFIVRARGGFRFVTRVDSFGSITKQILLDPGGGHWVYHSDADRLAQANEIEAVSFGGAQTLTAPEQGQARDNIAAAAEFVAATHAVYIAKTGDDAASGLAPNVPRLTIGAGITQASALITAGATGVRVHVLDGGTYTENVILPTAIVLDARAATLVGTLSMTGGAEVYLDRHYAAANNQTMATMSPDAEGPAIYVANVSDGRGTGGTLTGVRNVRNNGGGGRNFFIRVGIMFVGAGGIGLGDTTSGFGHIHLLIPDLYLAGNNAVGIDAGANGANGANIIGFIDHILEINAPTGTVGVQVTAAVANVRLVVAEIVADTAYNISAGSLYLVCPRIVGAVVGAPLFLAANERDLGTAALLTSTAVGEDLVTAADVDGARGVLDLPPVTEPPIVRDWNTFTWSGTDIIGSGSGVTLQNTKFFISTGTTANSQYRYRVNDNGVGITKQSPSSGINWSRRLTILINIRADVPNAEGVTRFFAGKPTVAGFGLVAGLYVGFGVENQTITSLFFCNGGAVTEIAVNEPMGFTRPDVFIDTEAGNCSWYLNGTLIGSTALAPSVDAPASLSLEINNGATPANYRAQYVVQSRGY